MCNYVERKAYGIVRVFMKGDYGAMMVWQEIGRGPFEE